MDFGFWIGPTQSRSLDGRAFGPVGNATLEADVIQSTSGGAKQFATLQVSPNGVVTSPTSSGQIATLQATNGALTLTYNFVVAANGYQNTFQVPLTAGG